MSYGEDYKYLKEFPFPTMESLLMQGPIDSRLPLNPRFYQITIENIIIFSTDGQAMNRKGKLNMPYTKAYLAIFIQE